MAIDKKKMEHLLSLFPPGSQEARDDVEREIPSAALAARRRGRLKSMEPQRVLDLHGAKAADVERMVSGFLEEGRRLGLDKLLIIHGKGHHSSGQPVLRKLVIRALESSALAGEFGQPPRDMGGSGALWVILRHLSR